MKKFKKRELLKRAKYNRMAQTANSDLDEHIKATAEELDGYETESDASSPKNMLQQVFEKAKKLVKGEEQASSSTGKSVYPTGVNSVTLPTARTRSTSRKGTKREGDDPEAVPRRIRSKSKPPIQAIPEAKPKGRPSGSKNKPKQ